MPTNTDIKAWTKPVNDEVKEAVIQIADTKMGVDVQEILDISGLTPADIVDTLFMKVLDGELFNPEYEFHLVNIFEKINVRLGNKEFKYGELDSTSDTLDIQSENTIADFNGEFTPEYAELYVTDQIFHKKVKLPELVLSNAWAAAEKMVEFVQLQVESMDIALAKRSENFLWTKVFEEATTIEAASADVMDINRTMYNQMLDYTTTSQEHVGIGTDGVISISTVSGEQTTQPDLKFKAEDFVLFVNTDQYTDTVFDAEAVWYNYAATSVNWATVIPLSFAKYSGFKAINDSTGAEIAPAVVVPEGLPMIAIHKEFLQRLVKFEYTESLKGRGPWTILHRHDEFGAYRVKTKPAIMVTAPAAK